nr:hypothetical protein [Bradyrhizobium sp. 2S1]
MFDVQLNHKRDLLVVRQGSSIPLGFTSGRWQKRKRRVPSVSDEIKSKRQGYYMRKRSELKTN